MSIENNNPIIATSEEALILAVPGQSKLQIGEVTTVAATEGASASITGTPDAPILNLSIPRGYSGNETIDDNAGDGDTDKVWSADKSAGEITDLKSAIDTVGDVKRGKFFQYLVGGINSNGGGRDNTRTNRITTETIHINTNTIISVDEGFKFAVGFYKHWRGVGDDRIDTTQPSPSDKLIKYFTFQTEPLLVKEESYVCITLATVNNDELFYRNETGNIVYYPAAEECINALTIQGYNGVSDILQNRVENLENYLISNCTRLRKIQPTFSFDRDTRYPYGNIANTNAMHVSLTYNSINEYSNYMMLTCPGYYILAYAYYTEDIDNIQYKRYISYRDYDLDKNFVIAPYAEHPDARAVFIITPTLELHHGSLTEEQKAYITENAQLYVERRNDPALETEGDYADAKAVGDILIERANIEFLTYNFGGVTKSGGSNNRTDRIRFITNEGIGAFFVKEGTVITAAEGYKFNVALYSEYKNSGNFILDNFRSMAIGTYTVPKDCYIRVSLGNVEDTTLWSIDENSIKQFTQDGLAAQNAITISGQFDMTLKERVENLENTETSVISLPWESVNELKEEIPLNAIAYHALFDEMVSEGKIVRTLLGNIDNDESLPVYLYTLRNDMDHKDPSYARIRWNGSNELYQRPKIWLDAGIHGNERTMPFVLYSFIDKLINNIYYQDMLNAFDWYFIPLVNPWGFSHSAYNNSTGSWDTGSGYTSASLNNFTVYENTPEHHQGIRRNSSGVDANRDFSAFATQEAQIVRDAAETLVTTDNRNFIFAIDAHQASNGGASEVNALGSFLSLHYGAPQADKNFIYGKWMQAGGKTESIMSSYCNVNNVQSVFPWDGTNLLTMRNFLHNYADYAMCFEGGQTCAYYSGSTAWSNEITRTFCNTQYHLFLKKLTEHWM